jgi:hypothetical protein
VRTPAKVLVIPPLNLCAVSYITRPIWDHETRPDKVFAHVWADGVEVTENICRLHGFTLRNETPKVVDAVLFSTELDMLEIRWNEVRITSRWHVFMTEALPTARPRGGPVLLDRG